MKFLDPIRQWKKPCVAALLAYSGIRLWSSLILLINIVISPSVQPADLQTLSVLKGLENLGWFSRLFLAPWYRWDTVHYLEIAHSGYTHAYLTVWPPLYSGLVHLLSDLISPSLLAGLLVSNIAAIIALALLYQMAEDIKPGLGYRAIIYLTLFPVAFFLVAAYTESLYLLFAIACLRLVHRNRPGWAGLFAALATLTRLQGVILALPILYEGIRPAVQSGRLHWDQIKIKTVIAATAPLLAEVVFVMYIHFYLSFPWPWQTLNSAWAQHIGWPWEGLLGNFTSLVGIRQIETPISSLAQSYDLFLFLLSVTWLLVTRKYSPNLPGSYQLYAWAGLLLMLIKLDNQSLLVSASRYLLTIFPLFIAQALVFKNRVANLAWFAFSLASQAILLVCYSWWIWVA